MILRLAHVEIGVADMQRAREFYVDLLGFQTHQSTSTALYLRAADEYDLWSLKLTQSSLPGMASFGFRVSDSDDIEGLLAQHEGLGFRCLSLPSGHEPGRGEGLRISSPEGFVIDFHHVIEEVDVHDAHGEVRHPMRRRGAMPGTPPTVLDHVNLRVVDLPQTLDYFTGTLGFSVSEQALGPDGEIVAAWTRRTRSSHDVAMVGYPTPGVHHFAYLVADGSGLLRTADLLADAGHADRLQCGPGRHGVSNALAMYLLDPDGNRIELNSGDMHRDLDRPPISWTYEDFSRHGRFWWGQAPGEAFALPTPFLDPESVMG